MKDVGSKLACLGSCWCYVGHFGQQDGCQDGHSAIKNAKMSQDGAQEAAKLSQDGILGSKFGSFYFNFGVIFGAF